MTWHKNTGLAPVFYPKHPEQKCPVHLFTENEAESAREVIISTVA